MGKKTKNSKINSEIGRTAINEKTKLMLWAKAGGRCELCNCLLYEDSCFGVEGNFSEMAHIHAVSTGGPRHKIGMTSEEKNDINNLMLLCSTHHHMIDSTPEFFQTNYLLDHKKEHERRIRTVTEISGQQSCRIVTYFSNIDHQEEFSSERLLKEALLLSNKIPMQQPVIRLHDNSDNRYIASKDIFEKKEKDLEGEFQNWFDNIIKPEDGVGVFALAPQALLFKLGTLLNDQYNVYVYQCHRDGHKWAWPCQSKDVNFHINHTKDGDKGNIALVIDLSAEVKDDRIEAVLGGNCDIYHITIDNPNRKFVTSEAIQTKFVDKFRESMELLKNLRPMPKLVHVFPVMPNSLAIKAGMDYMPKSDLEIKVYEQSNSSNGFFEAITIGGKI